jgi:O-acetyl-ADP-ribose deacetylase (regulator of RNase III)
MKVQLVHGDLLEQHVDAIVNAWNRNIIPWWLLLPHGVSGAIKRRAGLAPFRELARFGPLPLGHAVHTTAGNLPHKAIIHVAGINMLWRSSPRSITDSTKNALTLAERLAFTSVALPLIGAGSGGMTPAKAEALMLETLHAIETKLRVVLVRYRVQPNQASD